MLNITLAIFCTVLQFVDFYSTYQVLSKGHGREGNPVMLWLFNHVGIVATFAVIKAVVIAAIWLGYNHESAVFALSIVAAFYTWVVWNNLSIMWRAK